MPLIGPRPGGSLSRRLWSVEWGRRPGHAATAHPFAFASDPEVSQVRPVDAAKVETFRQNRQYEQLEMMILNALPGKST